MGALDVGKRLLSRAGTATLVIASTLATLVAVDVTLRSVGYWPPISQPWHLERPNARVPHPSLILVSPSLLNDDAYAVTPGATTIVALGDSYTEGFPVGRANSYPAVMQRLLDESGWRTRVINVGVGATGPDQHLRLFNELVLPRVTPDVVVWQLYENDLADNVRQAVYGIDGDILTPWSAYGHWMFQRRVLYDALPLPASIKIGSPVLRITMRALEALGDRRVPSDPSAQADWSARKIRLEIDEMERLAASRGFATYYVIVSSQGRYLAASGPAGSVPAWSDDTQASHQQLEAILAGRPDVIDGWFVDETQWPREIAETLGSTRSGPGIDLFADASVDQAPLGHRHLNEAGYALLAHAVAGRLLRDRVAIDR